MIVLTVDPLPPQMMAAAARELAAAIARQLDAAPGSITLTRDEALLTQAMLEALAEQLEGTD